MPFSHLFIFSFFFNDTATTEIYTLSLHDALPIFELRGREIEGPRCQQAMPSSERGQPEQLRIVHSDRKSTRLNSSHANISYAVFCLKKKNEGKRVDAPTRIGTIRWGHVMKTCHPP